MKKSTIDYTQIDSLGRFSLKDKWGFADIDSGEIIIKPVWDILKVGYDHNLIFCANKEESEKFIGFDDRLKALISGLEPVATPKIIEKWGVYTERGTLIIEDKLTAKPKYIKPEDNVFNKEMVIKYYLLKEFTQYGVLCSDGRVISDTVLYKKDAMSIINRRYIQQLK